MKVDLGRISLFSELDEKQVQQLELWAGEERKHIAVELEVTKKRWALVGKACVGVVATVLLLQAMSLAYIPAHAWMVSKPAEPIPAEALTNPTNQWVMAGKSMTGEYLFVREPEPGVRCYASMGEHWTFHDNVAYYWGCANVADEPKP